MSWLYLCIAIVFEAGWAIGMKYSDSFTKLVPSALTVIAMIASVIFLALAIKELHVGTAYAVWTGSGAFIVAVFGMIFFNEPVFAARLVFLFLILAGVVGLKAVS